MAIRRYSRASLQATAAGNPELPVLFSHPVYQYLGDFLQVMEENLEALRIVFAEQQ